MKISNEEAKSLFNSLLRCCCLASLRGLEIDIAYCNCSGGASSLHEFHSKYGTLVARRYDSSGNIARTYDIFAKDLHRNMIRHLAASSYVDALRSALGYVSHGCTIELSVWEKDEIGCNVIRWHDTRHVLMKPYFTLEQILISMDLNSIN